MAKKSATPINGSYAFVATALVLALASVTAFGFAGNSLALSASAQPLRIALSATTPSSDILIGGTTDNHVVSYSFTAGRREGVLVDTITLHNCVGPRDADGDCADAGETTGNDYAIASVSISYTDSTGSTRTDTGILSGNLVTFSGMDFEVPANTTRSLEVSVDTNAVDSSTVYSGNTIQLNLNAKSQSFSAVGLTSGRSVTETKVAKNVIARRMVMRVTEPTVSLSSSSPSGASVPGMAEAFRFKTTAHSAGDVDVARLTFNVTASDNAGSGWNECGTFDDSSKYALYAVESDGSLTSVTASWTFYSEDGALCARSTDPLAYAVATVAETVSAGSEREFALYVDSSGASASGDDALQVSIPDQAELTALSPTLHALTWSDGTTTGSRINGLYIEHLAVTGSTLVY